tara:strand:- start:471 stop:1529 length:1059 start_codon:yes stop_codon:yes gene_type:complete
MFKPTPSSKEEIKHQPTLDTLHTKILNSFALEKEILEREKDTIIDHSSQTSAKKLRSITKKERLLNNRRQKYLLDSSSHVFSYFENKKEVSDGGSNNKKLLTSFFYGHREEQSTNTSETEQYMEKYDVESFSIDKYIVNVTECTCGGELVPVISEGVSICRRCGVQTKYIVEHEKPSFREPPKEVCFYAYKRINHFREILAQFQAKETTQIPEKVIIAIKHQVKKERMRISDLTNQKTKDILKKLNYNKYYEHIPFIKDKLGIKPPVMSPRLEEKLCSLFLEVEKQYAKHCPDYRVNFLNYYYVLYKMCELLKENQFLKHFPMLKDPIKRIEQDAVWRKICKDLGWTFIPTM